MRCKLTLDGRLLFGKTTLFPAEKNDVFTVFANKSPINPIAPWAGLFPVVLSYYKWMVPHRCSYFLSPVVNGLFLKGS